MVLIDAFNRGMDDAPLRGTLAWLLATCPDESIRDGARAVELAESLCAGPAKDDPWALDTLAAAYAEAGAMTKAVATAEQALRLANDEHAEALAKAVEQRLATYRAGQPYRERAAQSSAPAGSP
jgi:uncharacterized protein